MDEIKQWIEAEGSGHWFFIAFPVILLALFIWFSGRRVRFLIPSLLISIVIINPLFYKYWTELGLYAYWRILWVVPVVPVVAAVIPSLTERVKKGWFKAVLASVGVGMVVVGGTFLYTGTGGHFAKTRNAAKLPEEVVEIANRLLELEENPRVIAQDPIGVYIRQYTGKIDTLYGRDISGYILPWNVSNDTRDVFNSVSDSAGNLNNVSQYMLNNGYDYLILIDADREKQLRDHFKYADHVGEYGIYKPLGTPTVIKERNDLGQIIAVTTVNESGIPIKSEKGYSTSFYEYNEFGDTIREFHVDANGEGIEDENGAAGIEREVDIHGHLIMERKINKNGNPTNAGRLYAEIRWEYSGNNLVAYSYYDKDGKPVNNTVGFSRAERTFDRKGNIITEKFYDANGNQVDYEQQINNNSLVNQ